MTTPPMPLRERPASPRARWLRLGVACLAQLVLVAAAVAVPLRVRLTGTEYRLAAGTVDPVDPFRGAYVQLGYPGLTSALDALDEPRRSALFGHDVYLSLVRDGALWRARGVSAARPAGGPYLRCHYAGALDCGIGTWFLPEGKASRTGRDLADGAGIAAVRIDSSGRAALTGLRPRG